jgi:outer membrane lipoprotein-sorting protein
MMGRKGDIRGLLVCDGKFLWEWDSDSNTYTKKPAPANLKGIPSPFLLAGLPGMQYLFGESDVAKDLKKHATKAEIEGLSGLQGGNYMGFALAIASPTKFAGTLCDVVETKTEGFRIYLYIAKTDRLFRGQASEMRLAESKTKQVSVRNVETYPLVDPKPRFTPAEFTFTPPPGATLKEVK